MTSSISLDPMSGVSILVEPFIQHPGCEEISCGTATAFVVERDGSFFLVTNYHTLSGRRSTDGTPFSSHAGIPTHLRCSFHGLSVGTWKTYEISLYKDTDLTCPEWFHTECSESASFRYADVAMLPLPRLPDVTFYPVKMNEAKNVWARPCSAVTVIGFPGSRTSYKYFPIWITGNIASEPELDYDGLPILLVNATTTEGMSGSPVFQVVDGMYHEVSGSMHVTPERIYKFLGVYSGRIPKKVITDLTQRKKGESTVVQKPVALDIGIVWKPLLINTLIDSQATSICGDL